MGKKHTQNKISQTNKGELHLEQNVAIDDNILPSAVELEKLKEVEPQIIPWIMRRTEIEQDARIKNNQDIIELNKIDVKKTHSFNHLVAILGFILFVFILLLSAYLIYLGLSLQGTIFGGATILVATAYFLKIIYSSSTKNNQ